MNYLVHARVARQVRDRVRWVKELQHVGALAFPAHTTLAVVAEPHSFLASVAAAVARGGGGGRTGIVHKPTRVVHGVG